MTSNGSNGWRTVRVGDVADVIGGGTPSTKDPDNFGGAIPWITPKDLASHQGRRIGRGERNITEAGLSRSSARLLPERTVLLSSRAPIGYVAVAANPVATNQGFRSLVLRGEECPEFYYYLLKANRDVLESRAGGSTFREISGSAIKEIEFTIPAPAEQRRIASLLGALDDKIENSRAIVSTLEEIARALFRHRFVKFVGHEDLDESEIGPVPRGWRVIPVGEAVRVVGGSTPSTKEPRYWEGGDHCWATPKDLSGHESPVLIDTARHITQAGVDTISSRLLPAGTVLLSSRAPVGYTVISAVPVAVNQGFIAIPPSDDVPREYVLFWLRENLDRIKANAGGTTFAEISKRSFRPIPMLVPPASELEAFAATVRPMFDQIAAALRERVTLESAHAALMPKLINGAMRIADGAL